jgi:hypothetical protein
VCCQKSSRVGSAREFRRDRQLYQQKKRKTNGRWADQKSKRRLTFARGKGRGKRGIVNSRRWHSVYTYTTCTPSSRWSYDHFSRSTQTLHLDALQISSLTSHHNLQLREVADPPFDKEKNIPASVIGHRHQCLQEFGRPPIRKITIRSQRYAPHPSKDTKSKDPPKYL